MFARLIDRYGIWVILSLFAFGGMFGLAYHFGFPIAVNDESPPMAAAIKMVADHNLRANYPSFYYMPLSAHMVLPFVAGGLGVAYLFGDFQSFAEFERFIIVDFAKLLPAARLASVFYGLLSLWLLYRIALMLYGSRRLALASAWFFASSLMLVQLAHIARVWTMEVFLMLLALFFVARIWKSDRGEMKDYLGAALASALAFGVNVIGLVVFSALICVHFQKSDRSRWVHACLDRRLLASVGLIILSVPVMYYLNPYGFANFTNYASKFVHVVSPVVLEEAPTSLAAYGAPGEGVLYYARILVEYDPLLVLLALLGVVAWYRLSRRTFLWLACYEIVYYASATLLSGTHTVAFEPRYALPLYPAFALSAAVGFRELWRRARRPLPQHVLLFFILIFTLTIPTLWLSRFTLPATRVMAFDFVRTAIPDGSRLLNVDDRIPFPENVAALGEVASRTPKFMTKKRSWLREHPEEITYPAYFVTTTSYYSGSAPDASSTYDYVVVSWWGPDDRAVRLSELTRFLNGKQIVSIAHFPVDASDETESIDLANNMRSPAFRLWGTHHNGPVVDVYGVKP